MNKEYLSRILYYATGSLMVCGILVLCFGAQNAVAQEKKAVEFFEQGRYNSVLEFYTRNYKKGTQTR